MDIENQDSQAKHDLKKLWNRPGVFLAVTLDIIEIARVIGIVIDV